MVRIIPLLLLLAGAASAFEYSADEKAILTFTNDRRREAGPSWALEWIGALWAPAPGESPALGPLVFQLGQDPQLRNTDLLPVAEAPGRRLLYEASSRRTTNSRKSPPP